MPFSCQVVFGKQKDTTFSWKSLKEHSWKDKIYCAHHAELKRNWLFSIISLSDNQGNLVFSKLFDASSFRMCHFAFDLLMVRNSPMKHPLISQCILFYPPPYAEINAQTYSSSKTMMIVLIVVTVEPQPFYLYQKYDCLLIFLPVTKVL